MVAALLLSALASPAGAKVPQPAQVPADLAPALRSELSGQRAELVRQWDRLVARVQAHNRLCAAVPAGSPQDARCRANMAALKQEIAAYSAAVERFNLRVAAAPSQKEQPSGEGAYSLLIPADKEIDLGRQVAAKIENQCVLVSDPQVNRYMQRLGWRLSRFSGRPGLPYTFKVIDRIKPGAEDGIKRACGLACAGPGGVVYVNRRLLKYAANESELAGVLAHEIGHVAARHQVKELAKLAKSWGLSLAAAGLGADPVISRLVQRWVKDLAYYKFTRDDEREADRRGVEMLYRAGIKPTGLSSFLGRYARGRKGKGLLERLYATHPEPVARMQELNPLLADPRFHQAKEVDSPQFQQVRGKLTSP